MTIRARPLVRILVRLLVAIPVLVTLTIAGAKTGVVPSVGGCAQASGVHHAALVTEHSDGRVVTACVSFGADSITGDELLTLAHDQHGVESATLDNGSGYGKAACQIDYEPAQYPPSCWSGNSPFWALFVSRSGGAWTESSLGISSQTFRDGDAEGFRYEGQSDGSPPASSPRGVCPVTTPAPTAVTTKAATPAAHRVTLPTHTPSAAGAAVITAAATPTPTATTTPSTEPSHGATPTTAAMTSANRSAHVPAGSNTGALVAGILAGLLAAALLVPLLRARRRAAQRPPP